MYKHKIVLYSVLLTAALGACGSQAEETIFSGPSCGVQLDSHSILSPKAVLGAVVLHFDKLNGEFALRVTLELENGIDVEVRGDELPDPVELSIRRDDTGSSVQLLGCGLVNPQLEIEIQTAITRE